MNVCPLKASVIHISVLFNFTHYRTHTAQTQYSNHHHERDLKGHLVVWEVDIM